VSAEEVPFSDVEQIRDELRARLGNRLIHDLPQWGAPA
jgi:hypothetical protein